MMDEEPDLSPNGMPLFNSADISEAINDCNFEKAIGPDGFDGRVLKMNEDIQAKVVNELTEALN